MSNRNQYEIGQNRRPSNRGFGPPHMRGGGEKPKDFGKSISKLAKYAKRYIPTLVIAMICSIIGAATTLAGPSQLSVITDTIKEGLLTGIDLGKITGICKVLLTLYIAGSLLTYVQGYVMTTVTQKFSKSLRTDISQKINKLPLKFFDSTTYGDILSRVTNDVDTITMAMNQSIGNLVASVTLLIGSLLLMIITNFTMAATAVVATLFGFVIMMLIMRRSHKYFSRNQKNLGEMNGHIEEIYAGHNVVKAYNGERAATGEFDRINDALYDSNWKSQFLSGLMMPVMHFVGNLGYVAVCVVGALLTMDNRISFGVIVAFMMYIRNFTQPLNQIAQAIQQNSATAEELSRHRR